MSLSLIYGESGVGKTYSTLLSTSRLPEILKTTGKNIYYQIEPRDVKLQGLDLQNFIVVDQSDFFNIFNQLEMALLEQKFEDPATRPASLFFDSLSYLMNVSLQSAIEDETFAAGTFNSKRKMLNRVKTDMGGYGAVAAYMNRFCSLLAQISRKGVIVICSALTKIELKRTDKLYPNFTGQKFTTDFPGYFDLIGYVYREKKQPVVSFEAEDDELESGRQSTYIAKNVGNIVKVNPVNLNWLKILGFLEKEEDERIIQPHLKKSVESQGKKEVIE